MGMFGSPPPPPPRTITLEPPSGGPYINGLIFVIVAQLLTVPLCILAFKLKGKAVPLAVVSVLAAFAPLKAQEMLAVFVVEQGWSTPLDALAGRFCSSSIYAFCAFRIFGAAVDSTPKGADADLATWIAFATAACDPLFDKTTGKPIRPAKDAVLERIKYVLLRMMALSVVSSISAPSAGYPAAAYFAGGGPSLDAVAFVIDHVCVHLFMIYLFLSMAMDIGSLLLEVQGFSPLAPFENPIFDTRSPRDFWGKKWNVQVTATLKRCVFIPLRKFAGAPAPVAAIATFLSSGLFHEYQFLLSFPKYTLGSISFFFGMQAAFAFLDSLYSRFLGKAGVMSVLGANGAALQSLCVLIAFSPTVPYFSKIWIDEGMFDVMSAMTPQFKLQ